MDEQTECLATQPAAEYLSKHLPGSGDADYWRTYLINNRRASRTPIYRIPTIRIGNGAFYLPSALDDFVAFEKSRNVGAVRLSVRAAEALKAFGVGEVGGSATGRKLEYTATAQVDEATGETFAQLVIKAPLTVFRLSPKEINAFAAELSELSEYLNRGDAAPKKPRRTYKL